MEYTTNYCEVEKGTISNSVTATGTIEPVTKVDVGTQVSGIVSKLYVDYNSVVTAGQVIAELDRTNLMSALSSAEAMLKSRQSDCDQAKKQYERYKQLFEDGLVSALDYEQKELAYVQAQQSVVTQLQEVKRAQTNLGYATITSPIDGIVLSKEVEEGQTVAASFNTPTLFTIAQDLTDMRVIADVDEADIGQVKEGQRVTFTVDAFPEDTFEGTVTQVRQQASTTSNVVTYEVVIGAPNKELKLKPGLTASVTIFTLEMNDLVTVPNKALRFTPEEDKLNEGETILDCEGATKVWVKEGTTFKAIPVQLGITNGAHTEVLSGVKPGDKLVSEIVNPDEETPQPSAGNPFMPRPKGKQNDKKK